VGWSGDDFKDKGAPTTLGGVRVQVNGKPAFLNLISPGQINCVLPDGVGPGEVAITISNAVGTSDSFRAVTVARAPGLLAPSAFRSGDRQYVTALFTNGDYAGPAGLIPGVNFRPASQGDRLVFYGVGFGTTTPAIPAGQIAGQAATLPAVDVRFGGTAGVVEYAGVAPGLVGVYQISVVTPGGIAGDVPLTVSVDGIAMEQALWITMSQ
jgi:uncharacterized protein (TIGR03437 family)